MLAGSTQDRQRPVGGAYALVGTPTLHHFVQQGDHLGDIRWSLDNEMEWARGAVYWVGAVDLAHALEGMDGAGGRGSQ